jgi:hypothetical protein
MNRSIDYGLGLTNIDQATGIRYGVISIHEITQVWADSSEPDYGDPACPKCLGQAIEGEPEDTTEYKSYTNYGCHDYHCPACHIMFDSEYAYPESPLAYVYEDDGYTANQDSDDTDIFITRSPYYTTCRYCSPCAPGAGYVMDTVPDGVKAYCFGHDWFDNGEAPYPVYDVRTGKLIEA